MSNADTKAVGKSLTKAVAESVDKAADQANVAEYEVPDYLGDVSDPTDMGDPQMICFYGPHGHGKTWLGASASLVEGYAPVLLIDTEGSATGTVTDFPKGAIKIKRVYNLAEYQAVIRDIRRDPNFPFKTVMVDTFGQVLEWKHDEIWAKPLTTKNGDEDYQKMWGKLYDYGKLATDVLRQGRFKVIITMHEKEERDNLGVLYSRLWIDGSIKKYLPRTPDLTGLLVAETDDDADETTRTVYFGADATRATKTRFKKLGLPSKMVNPTMADIVGVIRENIAKRRLEEGSK